MTILEQAEQIEQQVLYASHNDVRVALELLLLSQVRADVWADKYDGDFKLALKAAALEKAKKWAAAEGEQ